MNTGSVVVNEQPIIKAKNKLCIAGFWLGVACPFGLSLLGIVPLVGCVLCIIGLSKYNQNTQVGGKRGIVGLVINIIYIVINAIIWLTAFI